MEALLELLREGEVQPSSSAIATRAGLTQRTLFNHFADMEELRAAAATRQMGRIRTMLPDVAPDGALDARVEDFTRQLAALLEDTMHVRWAVLVNDVRRAAGIEVIPFVQELLRRRATTAFGPELEAMPARRRAQVLDSFDVLADAGIWRIRRLHHGQGYDRATASLARTLRALLSVD